MGDGSVVTRRAGDAHVLALVYEAPGYGAHDYFAFEALTGLLDAPATGVLAQAYAALRDGSWVSPPQRWSDTVLVLLALLPAACPCAKARCTAPWSSSGTRSAAAGPSVCASTASGSSGQR